MVIKISTATDVLSIGRIQLGVVILMMMILSQTKCAVFAKKVIVGLSNSIYIYIFIYYDVVKCCLLIGNIRVAKL